MGIKPVPFLETKLDNLEPETWVTLFVTTVSNHRPPGILSWFHLTSICDFCYASQ